MKSHWIKKDKNIFADFVMISGAVILFAILRKSIVNADTVWELADEAGYLSNTAYFLGHDWEDVRATMPYYAYGYSVFLIPVYLFTNTGVELIRGAMYINLFFAIGTYLILIYLMEKVGKQENRILVSSISFVVCLNSYLCCNVLKVDCEPLAVFWYCLAALVLYRAMKTKKKYWFVLLGAVSSFLFFIHTRMFVLIFAMILTLVITFLIYKEKNKVQLIWFGVAFLVCFIGMNFIKHSIISYAASLEGINDSTNGNLVNRDYILDRIKWFMAPENIELYILSFLSKVYYIVIVSAGTILFGYLSLCRDIFSVQTLNEDFPSYAVKLFLLSGMSLMVLACTLNGAGILENFCYFFYARYYENTVIPMIAFSILGLVTLKWKSKYYFIFITIISGVGIGVSMLKNYLYNDNIWLDTARIPGFSWLTKNTSTFYEMILWGTAISIFIIVAYYLINEFKPRSVIILSLVLIMTWKSTSLGINRINEVHVNSKPDAELAEYILDSGDCEKIYMIDDESYSISRYYSRMQVLLKDIPVKVIYINELDRMSEFQSGTWVLTYTSTTLKDTYLAEFECVMSGQVFELWRKA